MTMHPTPLLFRQWRNLITRFPYRCDPDWVDLDIAEVEHPDWIALAQVRGGRADKAGYAAFLEDMAAMVEHPSALVTPRQGAPFLGMGYLKGNTKDLTFDYLLVPRMSAIHPAFASAPDGMGRILETGRFVSSGHGYYGPAFASAVGFESSAGGFHDLYDDTPAAPMDKPESSASVSAEREWIGLNMLAEFRFSRETLQLLYVPVCAETLAPRLIDRQYAVALPEIVEEGPVKPRTAEVLNHYRTTRRHTFKSPSILFTANDMAAGAEFLERLELPPVKMDGVVAEDATDLISGRNLTGNRDIDQAREAAQEKAEGLAEDASLPTRFMFSIQFPAEVRDVAIPDGETSNLIDTWFVRAYDSATGEVRTVTLDEWLAWCEADGVAMPERDEVVKRLEAGESCSAIAVGGLAA